MQRERLKCTLLRCNDEGRNTSTRSHQSQKCTYKFRLMLVNGQRGVVHGGAHGALLAELPLLLLAQRVDFFSVHNVFGKEWYFCWLQLLCNLCG